MKLKKLICGLVALLAFSTLAPAQWEGSGFPSNSHRISIGSTTFMEIEP